ncbi:MAG: 3'-5' exonuclease [bacterium]|nr:3'-5' exonuclease [bacterium]
MNYLDTLNERQKEAVLHKDGPLLIVAGAGAGKTKTVTHRIAHLIAGGVDPRNILAVTFTNKAAKEMRDRVLLLLPIGSNTPTVSTFHSLGVLILKENANVLGINKYFSILDKDESQSLIKKSAKELGIGPKDYNANAVQAVISREKNKLKTPDQFGIKTEGNYFNEMVHNIWVKYEKKLGEQKAFDFDDLIQKPLFLLRDNQKVREYYQNLWKYVHIDEYQDTNVVQYELSKLLAEKHGNICVVGDSDQAIYSWRQADYKNILNFEQNFPGTKTVLLEENYRSTKTILDAANGIIKKNKQRKEKNLFTSREGGEKIRVYGAFDEGDEARWIIQKIKELLNKKVEPSYSGIRADEIAVLYRANFQSRILEEKFLRSNIPYQMLGTRFYERKEVKDVIALMQHALNPADLQSMERIINIPPRGIGDVSFNKIATGQEGILPAKLQEKLREFRAMIARIKEVILKEKLSDSIKYVVKNSGIADALKLEGEEGEERIENLKELVTIASKYDFLLPEEAVDKFLTETSLLSDQDSLMNKQEGVKLMTVHASKGLEFKYVFVTGLEEDLFPHRRLNESEASDPEEERRLFYVAVTRAKDQLFLSYANMRTIFGQKKINMPSQFLQDISDDLAEFESNSTFDSFSSGAADPDDIIEWDCLK